MQRLSRLSIENSFIHNIIDTHVYISLFKRLIIFVYKEVIFNLSFGQELLTDTYTLRMDPCACFH